ncbi:hypothetical protein E2C01_030543 [Portunus trituberculatus]|uniref:Uncharacterized protein n=1 Tax=Portunus trituberculatus TaxID=210409 RepID=A0A5B7EVL2_PORTR|nr:hypothetical protein [Portunus trituberculatus]
MNRPRHKWVSRRLSYRDGGEAEERREEANVELTKHVAHIETQDASGARELSHRQPVQVWAASVGRPQGGEGGGAVSLWCFHPRSAMGTLENLVLFNASKTQFLHLSALHNLPDNYPLFFSDTSLFLFYTEYPRSVGCVDRLPGAQVGYVDRIPK